MVVADVDHRSTPFPSNHSTPCLRVLIIHVSELGGHAPYSTICFALESGCLW